MTKQNGHTSQDTWREIGTRNTWENSAYVPNLSREECNQIALVNTLGEAILVHTMKQANFFLAHSGVSYKSYNAKKLYIESRECYYFVQGTGLDKLLSTYSLNYDPNNLRNTFNYCVRRSI